MTVSARTRAGQTTDADQEVLMNDARRAATGTRRPAIERVHSAVLAAAGSSDLVAGA